MKIRAKLLFFFKGSAISKVLGFVTFLLFAKVVSLADFATYAIFLFGSEILTITLTYGFHSYILRNSNKNLRDDLFPKTLFVITITIILCYICILLFKLFLSEITLKTHALFWDQVSFFTAIIFTQCLLKMIYGYLVSNHLAREHMRVTIFHSSSKLAIASFLYSYYSMSSLDLIFCSILFSNLITLTLSICMQKQNISLKAIGPAEAISLIYESSPFMFKSIVGIAGLYLSRIILDSLATKEELAVYSFYLMIVLQFNFFGNVISQAVMPTIRDSFEQINTLKLNLSKYLRRYSIFAIITYVSIVCATYIVSSTSFELLRMVVKEEYLRHVWLFPVFALSFLIGMTTTIYNVWQYHEDMDVKFKLVWISAANLLAGITIYPLGYASGNIYGVAAGYLVITTIFTCVSAYYFNQLIRGIEDGKNLHNC